MPKSKKTGRFQKGKAKEEDSGNKKTGSKRSAKAGRGGKKAKGKKSKK